MLCLPVEFHGRNGFAFAHRPIVAVYTVASERARGEALAAAAVVGVCAAVVPMGASSVAMALVMRIENVAFVVVAALGGFGVRMYHAYMEETRRRLAEAERTREELAARRVADERVRIAREVHDITAHSLSAVTIQAAAAERLIDLNPAAAKEAIADIRSVRSRRSMRFARLSECCVATRQPSMRPPKAPNAWATSCRSCSVLASRSI